MARQRRLQVLNHICATVTVSVQPCSTHARPGYLVIKLYHGACNLLPEPLPVEVKHDHDVPAEHLFGCMGKLNRMSCPAQVREAPVQQMTLLTASEAHAEHHAALLARRPNLHSVAMLRWVEWECSKEGSLSGWARLRLPQAPRWEHTADAALQSLPMKLRSLDVGVFILTQRTLPSLGRCSPIQIMLITTCLTVQNGSCSAGVQ